MKSIIFYLQCILINLRRASLFIALMFPTFGSEHYGIGIEDVFWRQSEQQRGLRVVFFDLNNQRAIEVNYYTPRVATGNYTISNGEHASNPIRGFVLDGTPEKKIVVSPGFNTDRYTVVSDFLLFRLKTPLDNLNTLDLINDLEQLAPAGTIVNRTKHKYAKDRNLLTAGDLTPLFIRLDEFNQKTKYAPTFRLIDMMGTHQPRVSELQEEALEENGEAKYYKFKKEEMGEIAAILTILNYGYKIIYDTKLSGIFGIDIVFATGENPHQDELFITEAKWTSNTNAPKTLLSHELNTNIIIDRILKLKNKTENTADGQLGLAIIEKFFTTPHAKIYKMIYKVFDNSDRSHRGTVRPYFEKIREEDRVYISKEAGYINPILENVQLGVTTLVPTFINMTISSPSQHLVDRTTMQLRGFVNFLNPRYSEELLKYLRETYPEEYQKWSASGMQ